MSDPIVSTHTKRFTRGDGRVVDISITLSIDLDKVVSELARKAISKPSLNTTVLAGAIGLKIDRVVEAKS